MIPFEYETANGMNEEFLTYSEEGLTGTFTFSRALKDSYDPADEDIKGGFKKQSIVDAWNSTEANRASIQDDSFTAISVKNGTDGNNDEINISEDTGIFSVSVTGNTLSINLEKKIEDYNEEEIAAIISTVNSDPANTLFQITSTSLSSDTFKASGGGEWGGTGGLIGKITDQNGGSSFDDLINNLAKGGDFTTYSAESPTHTHKMENLNQWLGRDREEVTYEETEDADGNPSS